MQLRALVSHGRFWPMAQVAILVKTFDQVRKDLDCELFYSELKRQQRLTLYLLSSHR